MNYNLNEENKERVLNLRHKDYLIKIKHSDVHSIIKRIRFRTSLTKRTNRTENSKCYKFNDTKN